MEKRLSIIIPHYNTPLLLERLLSSIPSNDMIQVIVVDDISTENIDDFLKVKQKFSERVEFYDNPKENKSPGGARNYGIEKAKGQWIIFADSDDYFTNSMWEVVKKYMDRDEDIIYFPPYSVIDGTDMSGNRHVEYSYLANELYVLRERHKPYATMELKVRAIWTSPCSKIIKKELIDKYSIRFDKGFFSEDRMFSVQTGLYAKKIMAAYETIYIITCSNESITNRAENFERRERDTAAVAVRVRKFLLDKLTWKQYATVYDYSVADMIVDHLKHSDGVLGKLYRKYRGL